MAYLAVVFEHKNVVNLSLQGNYVDIFLVEEKINPITKKFQIWSKNVDKDSLSNFPTLKELLDYSSEKYWDK